MSSDYSLSNRDNEFGKTFPKDGRVSSKKNDADKGVPIVSVYRSQFEKLVALKIKNDGGNFMYETVRIPYTPKIRHYTPDFYIPETNIYIEAKGRLTREDRTKMLLVKQQCPEYDIRFVFANCRNKLYKGSKTTYADWCMKHGFDWAEKSVPREWLKNEQET